MFLEQEASISAQGRLWTKNNRQTERSWDKYVPDFYTILRDEPTTDGPDVHVSNSSIFQKPY